MSLTYYRRVFCIFSLFSFLNLSLVSAYEVPDVKIQAFRPKGFRASIPSDEYLHLFAFQGNVNRPIGSTDVGTLHGEVTSPTNDSWVFEEPGIELNVGDVINYYVFVSVNSSGYIKDKLSFKVQALEDLSEQLTSSRPVGASSSNNGPCKPTVTIVYGKTACQGQTIFEDNFDSLKEDLWQIEQYAPTEHPEFPFVSYQRATVSVSNGNLRISPKLQQNMPGYTVTLNPPFPEA